MTLYVRTYFCFRNGNVLAIPAQTRPKSPGMGGGGKKYSSTVYQKILAVSGYQQRLPEESLLLHTRNTQRVQYYSVEGDVLNLIILLMIEI